MESFLPPTPFDAAGILSSQIRQWSKAWFFPLVIGPLIDVVVHDFLGVGVSYHPEIHKISQNSIKAVKIPWESENRWMNLSNLEFYDTKYDH